MSRMNGKKTHTHTLPKIHVNHVSKFRVLLDGIRFSSCISFFFCVLFGSLRFICSLLMKIHFSTFLSFYLFIYLLHIPAIYVLYLVPHCLIFIRSSPLFLCALFISCFAFCFVFHAAWAIIYKIGQQVGQSYIRNTIFYVDGQFST